MASDNNQGKQAQHVKTFEKGTFLLSVLVSVFSAIICMQIISRIGFTPNTSIIGALIAMTLARIPFAHMDKFRSLDRQNLVQTMTSGAGFAAANCTLLAVGIMYAFGDMGLVFQMLIGSGIATMIGMHMVYKCFDSELFPATAPGRPASPPPRPSSPATKAGGKAGICCGALSSAPSAAAGCSPSPPSACRASPWPVSASPLSPTPSR